MQGKPIAAGKSSFDLIDPVRLFAELQLKKDSVLLDLACGNGSYTLAASEHIDESGKIYAFDLWKEGIDSLLRDAAARQIRNIHAGVADIDKNIPVDDNSIDVCLMATVLHDLVEDNTEKGTLQQVVRVLKPNGLLAVIEFNKVDGKPGPPVQIRISPAELENIIVPYGFRPVKTVEAGQFNYLSLYRKAPGIDKR
jgi:ubiquinone/menaquinone biosynthesis C-methylase UbiE